MVALDNLEKHCGLAPDVVDVDIGMNEARDRLPKEKYER